MQALTTPSSYLSAAVVAANANSWRVSKKASLSCDERQDVEQEILLALLEREPRFDPARGMPSTFTGVVSMHRAAELTEAIVRDGYWQQVTWKVIQEFGQAQRSGIEIDAVVEEVKRTTPVEKDARGSDRRRESVIRGIRDMAKRNLLQIENDAITLL